MARLPRSILLGICILLSVASSASAAISSSEVESVLQRIESRHYRWVAIRADVLLFFAGAGHARAMCSGELLYHRLDERMFLSCVDTNQELVFAFRSYDRRFDLYLPSQQTLYHGTIFDLEDSPEIESHLKIRDLYRALKPLAVDPRRAKIDRANPAITSLGVYSPKNAQGALTRKLYLTPEGDVRGELFYNPEGRPVTEIQRYDFKEIPAHVGTFQSVIFPKKITIFSNETQKGSALFFTAFKALDDIDPLEFILRVPEGTKEIFLREKNPRFSQQPPPGKRRVTAAPEPSPVPTLKIDRSHVTTAPLKKTETTSLPVKKDVPESPRPKALPEKPALETKPSPILPDKKTPPPAPLPEDSTLPVEESSDPYSALNSLDPSLEPSADMVVPEKTN